MMLLKTKKSKSDEHTHIQWIVAIIANIALLSYGLQAGWTSPMTKLLQSSHSPTEVPLTDQEMSWIASTICIGAGSAAPVYSYIADNYGRKNAVIAIVLIQAISWIVKLLSTTALHFVIARALCGIASGGCFNIVPMYTKEISQDNIRGLLGSLTMLLQNIGILLMYSMGTYLDFYTVLWIVLPVTFLNLLLLLKIPETPAFLVKTGEIEKATSALTWLRGSGMTNKSVQNEISCLINEDAYFKSLPKITFSLILKDKVYRKIFILMIAIVSVAACNGNFAIMTFAASIMESSGVIVSPELQTLSFPVVMIVGSMFSMICVEKFGRKPLLFMSCLLSTLAFAVLGTIIQYQNQGGFVPAWLPIIPIVTSVFMYSAGVSPMPYVIMSEILNFQIRSMVMGIIVMYAWFVSFVQLYCFAPISSVLGMHTAFYCFAGINLLGALITLIYLPETKGKSPEQMEDECRAK